MQPSDLTLLLHIRQFGYEAVEIADTLRLDDFMNDRKSALSVAYLLQVVGEATTKLSREFRSNHPEIPWQAIVSFKNRIVHDYFGVDFELVWKIATHELRDLLDFVERQIVETQ